MPITPDATDWDQLVPYEVKRRFALALLNEMATTRARQLIRLRREIEDIQMCLVLDQELNPPDGGAHFGLVE